MKTYYYNLGIQQASRFASLKTGEKMVIVEPFKKQPPEGYIDCEVGSLFVKFKNSSILFAENTWFTELPYPLGAKVGLRETWAQCKFSGTYIYKVDMITHPKGIKWNSSQCMPHKAINQRGNWGIVEDVRVKQTQDITYDEAEIIMGGTF